MLVTAGNLTGLVDRAERDGAVERRPDPSDRRLSRVFLTPRGRDLVQSLIPVHAAHVSELLSSLEASERRDLRRLLGRLRGSLAARAAQATHRPATARERPRREPRDKR
jgi:DNA-binding MarR family transcriptional regulator